MEELAQVYARALFEVAREQGKLDELRDQLAQFADALEGDRQLAIFFFSPYFSSSEKEQGLARMLEGADESFVRVGNSILDASIRNRLEQLRRHVAQGA